MTVTLASSEFRATLEMMLDALPQPALLLSGSRRVFAANREYEKQFGRADLDGLS